MKKQKAATFLEDPPPAVDDVLPLVLSLSDSNVDRNSVSLVCKSWYDIERWNRRHVIIGNCYAVNPPILVRRFPNLLSITIKGNPNLTNYYFESDVWMQGWGALAFPWIAALTTAYPDLREIRLKRMNVTDEGLELIAMNIKKLRILVLCRCYGFSTYGLTSIAANCSNLITLDLCQSEVEDMGNNWISHFPYSYTSLEFLNLANLESELDFSSLEKLVCRCPNLKTLRVNHCFTLENLLELLPKAPQLVDLGIGSFTMNRCPEALTKLVDVFAGCKRLRILSGIWNANPYYLKTIYPLCSGLTSLDLSHTNHIQHRDLVKLLHHCPNLQCLRILPCIQDYGLHAVASSCKELQELSVVFPDPYVRAPDSNLSEHGIVSVSMGCPKLHSIQYFCIQMTNAALLEVAKYKPNLTHLSIVESEEHKNRTQETTLDNGFTAILESCKSLKSLAITTPVSDQLLQNIGIHGKKLERLWLNSAGDSDNGLHYVLSGCSNLRKLVIIGCPFNGQALLSNSSKLETMRFVWISSSPGTPTPVRYRECKVLKEKHPRLNVEITSVDWNLQSMSDECVVRDLYVYRTVAGPRLDVPGFVRSVFNPL